ncbi:Rubrerythrin [Peptoclostridium litorale DSM 5388]|uniref:Putative rubrerythrin n=1 Tax=Peptoclostridium litorale DSM 5388 TaxID=1121324 RepID=A0A069RGK3_PEPLI|nr:ferritin family protein [Peptoclostridium litorale]KDR96116.1 putative rubrerythrin [Peptoclostridium litorale DSM 5388]SIO04299.1 Rubrerythrin [Peptoclostridium litorale DSM 5388]
MEKTFDRAESTKGIEKTLDIIKFAMEMEKKGQEFYLRNMDKVKNPRVRKIFESLADVEDLHYKMLKRHHDTLSDTGDWEMLDMDLCKPCAEKLLTDAEIEGVTLEYDISDITILRMAYLIENDFAQFYHNAAKSVENTAAKKILSNLESWEIQHREAFYDEYKKAMEQNWFDQSFAPF